MMTWSRPPPPAPFALPPTAPTALTARRAARSLLLASALVSVPAAAQVPLRLTHHGVLEYGGAPVSGNIALRFRLYDGPSAQSPFWEETVTATVSGGYYALVLGASAPLDASDLAAAADPELGIAVAGGDELQPRLKVTSVPYALAAERAALAERAQRADDLACLACVSVTEVAFAYAASASQGGAALDLSCTACIATSELADALITGTKLAPGAVSGPALAAGAVGSAHLAPGAVTSAALAAGAVVNASLADGAVTSAKLQDGSVTSADLADGACLAELLDDDGPGSGLDADRLDGQHGSYYLDTANHSGTIADGRLSANVMLLDVPQTATGVKSFSQPIVSAVAQGTPPLSVTSTTEVANLNADLLDGQHGSYYLDAGNLANGTLADARLSSNVALLSAAQTFSGAKTFSQPLSSTVASGTPPFSVSSSTLVNGLNVDLLDGQHAAAFAATAHDHDAAYVNEGQANAITSAMIANGSIVQADLADNAVGSAQIIDGAVAAVDLASNAVTTAKIVDGNVTLAKLAACGANQTLRVNGAGAWACTSALTISDAGAVSLSGALTVTGAIQGGSGRATLYRITYANCVGGVGTVSMSGTCTTALCPGYTSYYLPCSGGCAWATSAATCDNTFLGYAH